MNHKPTADITPSRDRVPAPAQPRSHVPTVLVPLDGSPRALAALPVARALAELAHAVIHLVRIADTVLPPPEVLHRLELDAGHVGDAVVDQAGGDAAEGIVRVAEERRSVCVVMCTYTGQKEPTGGLGDVSRAVLCTAPCPVVLVPPACGHRPLSLRRILLPYDGTPTTAAAFGPAFEIAERAEAELLVLHVVAAGTPCPVEPGSISVPRYVDQAHHEWPAWTHGFLRRACCSWGLDRKLNLRLALAVGEPGGEIVRCARDRQVDLIVLAWHGQLEPTCAAVVKAVVLGAPCPLLLLRVIPPLHPSRNAISG